MLRRNLLLTAAFLGSVAAAAATPQGASAQEAQTLAAEGRDLAITLYNQDLAFFEERRGADLSEGLNRLALEGVASSIQPQTLYLDAPGVALVSQSYQPATLSRGSLVEAFLGEEVAVLLPSPEDRETLERKEGRLLSLSGGPLVEVEGELLFVAPESLRFPEQPENLRGKDALLLEVESSDAGRVQDLEVGYLASGFSWQADYVARYDEESGELGLAALASLANNTPDSFEEAAISLVAGDINRVPDAMPVQPMRSDMVMAEAAMAPMPKQESAGEYHRYVLPGRVDLPAQSLKQVTFLTAESVPVSKRYRLEGLVMQGGNRGQVSGPMSAATALIFDNSEANNLGRALPGGSWRVYGESAAGGRLLLGEASQGHIPADGEVELTLGRAFDVRGEAAVTDFKRITNRSYEIAQSVTVTNAKDIAVEVEVVGVFPPDLRVLSESQGHEAEAAGRLVWTVPVEAGSETELTFRLLVNY